MTVCVLDCSTALSWVLPAEANIEADHLLDRVALDGAIVPALWPLEIGNVLVVAQRRGWITVADRHQALTILGDLPIEIDSGTAHHAWGDTLNLAAGHNLTLYDACYLEAALRLGLTLATLDRNLGQAARACGVTVIPDLQPG